MYIRTYIHTCIRLLDIILGQTSKNGEYRFLARTIGYKPAGSSNGAAYICANPTSSDLALLWALKAIYLKKKTDQPGGARISCVLLVLMLIFLFAGSRRHPVPTYIPFLRTNRGAPPEEMDVQCLSHPSLNIPHLTHLTSPHLTSFQESKVSISAKVQV